MTWIEASCPRCSLNVTLNGRRRCGVCDALLIYRAAPRVRVIDCRGISAFLWHDDDLGHETVMVRQVVLDTDGREKLKVSQERGVWLPVQNRVLRISKPDQRKAGLRDYLPHQRRLRYA